MNSEVFDTLGYFKEYYTLDGKYIGFIECERDRDVFGYTGRKTEITATKITLQNKKVIKQGKEVITQLQKMCGRRK